jgi:hypothetical protein
MFKIKYFSIIAIVFIAAGFKYGGENELYENKIFKGNLHCPKPTGFKESVKVQKHDTKQKDGVQSKDDIDQSWLSTAIDNIKHEEYNIVYDKQINSYESPNRKNNIDFIYNDNGFTAKTLMRTIPLFDVNDKTIKEKDKKFKKIPAWQINFKLSGYTRNNTGSEITGFNGINLKADSNKANIKDENISIDYENNEEGMRQDFTINNKPDGSGMLKLVMEIHTKLKMLVGSDALMFKDRSGREVMKYSALKAYDATGKELRAYFKKSQNNKEFSIIVDEENAQYPIKIDPLSATSNWAATGENTNDQFGVSVSTAGDVNGDGYSDVIIGAFNYSSGRGKAYVYYGSSTGLSATPNWTAIGENTQDYFGISVSTAGDVNGDGYSDVIIGAHGYPSYSYKGKAYVYSGSSSGLSATPGWTATGENTYNYFGYSVSTAGDVNGDGYSDVILDAFMYSGGRGKAYVYHGSSTGLSATPGWTATGENTNDRFGYSVSTAGDVNGDGYSDVIIGAYSYLSYTGKAYVYNGSSTGLSATPNWTATGENANDRFGYSVSTAGDINGDGYSDVIIGAYNYSGYTGKAYVYNGSSTGLSATPGWAAIGETTNNYFGYSVSTAGDVNGDGYSDVIIGAYNYSGYTGKAYVYNGSSTGLSATPGWAAIGETTNNNFGISVATTGDINGDGYSDVIIGAYGYSSAKGKAYVYYGNGGTGMRSTLNQYKPYTTTVIAPGGLSGTNGQVRLSMLSKSPFGRTKGKLVYEYGHEGAPFSGSIITNSTGYTGMSSSWTDLTTSGVTINNDITSITTYHSYNWRVRVKYNLASNPYQVYGPWKYYKNFMPLPSGGFLAQDGPLPVNMNYFTYSIDKNNVKLRWETATEINNSGFEVQRKKTNEQNWTVIGWSEGNGTTNQPKDYMFDDNKLQKANYKYRLRQVDYNGNFEYHNLAGNVIIGGPKDFKVSQNYPNPSNPKSKIDYQIPFDGKVTIKIYDITGREVATLVNEIKISGYYTAEFDGTNLASGVYFYRINAEGSGQIYTVTKKMVLVK